MISRDLRHTASSIGLVLAATLLVTACSTGRQTSIATLITASDRARANATTISEDGTTTNETTATPRPVRRVLAASGNVLLPVEIVRVASGPLLTGAAGLGAEAPGIGLDADHNGQGVQIAATTPLTTAAMQLQTGGPAGASSVGAALTTPIAGANAGLTPTGVNASIAAPVGGASLGVAAPSSGPTGISTSVVTGSFLSPVLPATPTIGATITAPGAGGVLSPVTPVVSGATAVVAPIASSASTGVASLLGRAGL